MDHRTTVVGAELARPRTTVVGTEGARPVVGRPGPTPTLLLIVACMALAASAAAQATLPPDLVTLLQSVNDADADRLAVSEEDGRFLRLMARASRGSTPAATSILCFSMHGSVITSGSSIW